MQITEMIAVIIVSLASLAMAAVAGYGAYRVYKTFKNLELQITKFNENIALFPPLLEGVNNICESLTKSALKMNSSVEGFQKTLFNQSEPSTRKLNPYSDAEAGKSWDTMELMRERGISREQASEIISYGIEQEEGTFNIS